MKQKWERNYENWSETKIIQHWNSWNPVTLMFHNRIGGGHFILKVIFLVLGLLNTFGLKEIIMTCMQVT